METISINKENSKTNELHKHVLNLSGRLDFKSWNKQVALQNLSTYYTRKNIRKRYKSNELNIIAPTWNDEFELPDASDPVLDIQDYIEYIIKMHEALTTIAHLFLHQ